MDYNNNGNEGGSSVDPIRQRSLQLQDNNNNNDNMMLQQTEDNFDSEFVKMNIGSPPMTTLTVNISKGGHQQNNTTHSNSRVFQKNCNNPTTTTTENTTNTSNTNNTTKISIEDDRFNSIDENSNSIRTSATKNINTANTSSFTTTSTNVTNNNNINNNKESEIQFSPKSVGSNIDIASNNTSNFSSNNSSSSSSSSSQITDNNITSTKTSSTNNTSLNNESDKENEEVNGEEEENTKEEEEQFYGKGQFSNSKYSDPSTIVPPKSLQELITRLHDVFAADDICVEYVQKLMTSYTSNPSEWKRFAKFDEFKYTRNLVDEGNGKFNLMILCWNEAQGSSIHSHADSHCFLKILQGDIKEEMFHWPEKGADGKSTSGNKGDNTEAPVMRKKGDATFGTDQCAYINDSLGLHRVENESHVNKAVTLHLYSPPFQECQCFDQRSGRVTTAKMTFWSKYGRRTPYGKNPEKCQQPVENN